MDPAPASLVAVVRMLRSWEIFKEDFGWHWWLLKERVRKVFLGPRPPLEPLPPDHPLHQLIHALTGDYRAGKTISRPLVIEDLEPVMQNVTYIGPPGKRAFGETWQSFNRRRRWWDVKIFGQGWGGVYEVDSYPKEPPIEYQWWVPSFLRRP